MPTKYIDSAIYKAKQYPRDKIVVFGSKRPFEKLCKNHLTGKVREKLKNQWRELRQGSGSLKYGGNFSPDVWLKIKSMMDLVVLTGAGVSAESGIPTFRGKEGLWKNFKPEELATPEAFRRNPKLVWEWYNWRRQLISKAQPNKAHKLLAQIDAVIITQNVDGLHQRAGTKKVIELHGNIWRVRCTSCGKEYENYEVPLKEIPPKCKFCSGLLRPAVVWFGESLPLDALEEAERLAKSCKVFLVVGTSGVVYPAGLLPFVAKQHGAKVVEINPESTPISEIADIVIREKASVGVEKFIRTMLNL